MKKKNDFKMLWVGRSKNDKTGDIPQGYVGKDKEQTEQSCDGCPLRKSECYHWKATPRGAQASMQRTYLKQPKRYSLAHALSESRRMANYARGAVGGDPWVFPRETVEGWIDQILDQGMKGLLLYTHFAADKAAHLKGLAMASVHSLDEADSRIDEGWRAAMVADFKTVGCRKHKGVPEWNGETFTTPKGRKGIVCPAQYKAVDCNSCGLCDAQRVNGDAAPLIVFLKH